MRSRTTFFVAAIILLAVVIRIAATRFGWFPFNFSTMGAMALFAGATLHTRWTGIVFVTAGLLACDLVMRHDPQWLSVYLPYLLIALAAFWLKPGQSGQPVTRFALATVSASLIFFVVSNFGVWLMQPEWFERSIAGLAACYTQAIPFFRNTLAGDAAFGVLFFGSYALLENRNPGLAEA